MPDLDQLLEEHATLDLDHPLDEYATHLKDLHARNASEYFEGLVHSSAVDEQENARLVAEVRALETAVARSKVLRNRWRSAGVAGVSLALASVAVAFSVKGAAYLMLVPAVGAVLFTLFQVRGRLAGIRSQMQQLEPQRDAKRDEAWAQMEPLNRLHAWGVAPTLFQATFPAVQFDSHVSSARLGDLVANYGLSPDFGDGRSVLFSQSGSLEGNPLVFQRSLDHWMGTRAYSGSLVIYWTERVRNAEGRYVVVQRSQTLTASVVKPYPEFQERTRLIYGHEAAPALSFSRRPSKLSGLDDGRFNDWRKNRQVKKVGRQARRDVMTGDGQLTVMSNREFEALFNATDRDDEIGFRLLFTPLAQGEMVKLLNDRITGFGDDFAFTKRGAVNIVEPRHLDHTRFDGDPRMFHSLELAEARRFFNAFHADYFRSLYFSLAPLLTIPLYRERRSIPGADSQYNVLETCEWEHEAMANLYGEAAFKHPESITRSLLKTTSTKIAAAVRSVDVTAYGYGGIARVDFIPMRGGDGRVHEVPVPWTEYFGVQARRTMLSGVVKSHHADAADSLDAALEQDWNNALRRYGVEPGNSMMRGALAGHLLHS